ncbi:DinB family protein [Candidatus Leptofilum sp.]|uniref:DinB family protein n=1 Tax=Candidatus Leptofilum sp. TaxID=3241576 RepID=UPI003B5C8F7C
MSRAEKIALYGQAAELLEVALAKFPREMWQYRSEVDDWTIHEIIVHITDSEANSYVRCRRFIAEPGEQLMAYDENQWARVLDYHKLDADTAVSLFKWLRQSSYELIQTVPEATWQNKAHHSEEGKMAFADWLDIYSRHVPDHIAQMERICQAWQQEKPD